MYCKCQFPIIDGYWKTPRSLLCLTCKKDSSKRARLKYYSLNKKQRDEDSRLWKQHNRSKVLNSKRKYRQNNKDKVKAERIRYYSIQKNKEKKKLQDHNYYLLNSKKIGIRQRQWLKNKPLYLLHMKVSHLILQHLKFFNGSKNGSSSFAYIGYSVEDLKKHLEGQFESWMNWNNHGVYRKVDWDDNDSSTWKWQIDHIVPHSEFKYDSLQHPDFKKCWALENLRPLSAKKNLLKGNRKGYV